MKIVADNKIPFLKGVLESFSEVKYLPGKEITRKIISDADALLIRTRTKCTEDLLEGTKVRFIGTATIGFDHIDTGFCERNNIFWTNAPGCNSLSVKQYIAAAMLKLSIDKKYPLEGKTIGIVGVGNVGSKIEQLARTLGMNILLNDPPRSRNEGKMNFVDLGNILYESDIITIHVPLSFVGIDKTYHLFNHKSFKKMKKGTWVFNSSRGEVVDSESFKQALLSDKLGGAVIDVWENEPDIDIELMKNAYISTPHIAGYSTDGKANGTSMIVNSLFKYFNLKHQYWYPENVPQPLSPDIIINGINKSDQEVLSEAVLHAYNIYDDNIKFRSSPLDFEKQRGDYPLRREFPSYNVRLDNCSMKSRKTLETLGFNISV